MLYLRGPQYLMKTELQEMRDILENQEKDQMENAGIASKLKEMRSRAVLFPVLMMVVMFALQVSVYRQRTIVKNEKKMKAT